MRRLAIIVLLLAAGHAAAEDADAQDTQVRTSKEGLTYSLRLPASYSASAHKELWLALHGGGDTHGNFLKAWAPLECLQDAALAVPQGEGGNWASAAEPQLLALLDALMAELAPERIYVAGFSAGGQMAFSLGLAHNERFAGMLVDASPVMCSPSSPPLPAPTSSALPIYYMHGDRDERAPLDDGCKTVEALRSRGYLDVALRILPETGHMLRPWAITGGVAWLRAHTNLPPASDAAANLTAAEAAHDAGDDGRARALADRTSAAGLADEATRTAVTKLQAELDDAALKKAKKLAARIEDAKGKNRDWQYDDEVLRALHGMKVVMTLDPAILKLHVKQEARCVPLLAKGQAEDARKDYMSAMASWAKIQNECYLSSACKIAEDKIDEYLSNPEIRAKLKVK